MTACNIPPVIPRFPVPVLSHAAAVGTGDGDTQGRV